MIAAISGARGFVGRHLLPVLSGRGVQTVPIVRSNPRWSDGEIACDLDGPDECVLPPISHFIHLAARVHVMHEMEADPQAAYRRTNIDGTGKMLRAAHAAGAKRFVYLSSIKVLGEETAPGHPFLQTSRPAPVDAYGKSKLGAERLVEKFCADHGMEWVIVRPVLIYGPAVAANFAQLVRIVDRGWPLPFAAIRNRRSLLSVGNLCAFLSFALDAPAVANRSINLADPQALSTPELVSAIGYALGRRPPMMRVPPRLLELAGNLLGKRATVQRLTRSLEVDTAGLCEELGWTPPLTTPNALREVAIDVRQRG